MNCSANKNWQVKQTGETLLVAASAEYISGFMRHDPRGSFRGLIGERV